VATPLRWLARGEHELPEINTWLTPREAARAASMRFTKRRTEYLLRRWVGKQAVAAATGAATDVLELARIEVANRASGAPYVLVDGQPLGLDVSLTDRAGWAVCVVGQDLSRVGCDLEIVEPRSRGFVADFLTEVEQVYVDTLVGDGLLGDGLRDEAANLMWSAKESALKVLRTGLRRDTRSVEVTVEDPGPEPAAAGWGRLTISTSEGTSLPGWWRRDGVFVLTIAADTAMPRPSQMRGSACLREAVPVHSWVGHPLTSS
jgi:4'-phosphopantetheinyl transferase